MDADLLERFTDDTLGFAVRVDVCRVPCRDSAVPGGL
jgi:hypothetical protein